MKQALVILLVFLIYLESNCQSRKVIKLKNNYIESALQKFDAKKLPVIKWENKDTLNYHIVGDFKFMSKKSWSNYLLQVEKLINIKILETTSIEDADIIIFFGTLYDYSNKFNINLPQHLNISKFDNWHNRRYNKNWQLRFSTYCISTNITRDDKRGRFNLKKLFLKSLGLLGELDNEYSLFYKNQTDGNTRFSRNDKRIVKIHYNKMIKAGMNYNKVSEVLDSIDLSKIVKEKL